MKHVYFALTTALTACGADPSADTPTAAAQAQAPTEPATKPEPEPEDLFVSAASDLGPCQAEAKGRIVYVTTEDAFYACEATGTWHPLDLKGNQGETGTQGQAGTEGPKGDTGAQGQAGTKGDKGDDGLAVTDSMWFDPIALQWWTFTAATTTFTVASQSCIGDWRLPTAQEFIIAQARGLRVVATANFEAWLQDGTHVRYDGQTLASTAAPYCLEVTP